MNCVDVFDTAERIERLREVKKRATKLRDLMKSKTPTELIAFAQEIAVENAGTMRRRELINVIRKQLGAKRQKADTFANEVDDIQVVGGSPLLIGGMCDSVEQAGDWLLGTSAV